VITRPEWSYPYNLTNDQLDKACAIHVMGKDEWWLQVGLKHNGISCPWHPSSDIRAARECTEELLKQECFLYIRTQNDGPCTATITGFYSSGQQWEVKAEAETEERARAEAALLAAWVMSDPENYVI
jgi:hypothetical protein